MHQILYNIPLNFSMLMFSVYNQMAHHAASDLDETEHFVLYYNLALVAFLSKNFSMAQKILVKVHLGLTAGMLNI